MKKLVAKIIAFLLIGETVIIIINNMVTVTMYIYSRGVIFTY